MTEHVRIAVEGDIDAYTVDEVVRRVRAAATDGFDAIWFPQIWGLDLLTALAVAAREVPGIAIGTAVVPIKGRHPIPLAQQALTVADAAGPGRLTLGLGVAHARQSEGWYGISYSRVVDLCREELEALSSLLSAERRADLTGSWLTARATLTVEGPPPGLVLAALGPRMLALAGRLTDGTITYMTGPDTLRRDIVPRLEDAAAAAGRQAPRVITGVHVCVTNDVARLRREVGALLAPRAQVASYKRMIAAEGIDDVVDLAIIGDADTVLAGIERLARAGATEILAHVEGNPDERVATRALLAAQAVSRG